MMPGYRQVHIHPEGEDCRPRCRWEPGPALKAHTWLRVRWIAIRAWVLG